MHVTLGSTLATLIRIRQLFVLAGGRLCEPADHLSFGTGQALEDDALQVMFNSSIDTRGWRSPALFWTPFGAFKGLNNFYPPDRYHDIFWDLFTTHMDILQIEERPHPDIFVSGRKWYGYSGPLVTIAPVSTHPSSTKIPKALARVA